MKNKKLLFTKGHISKIGVKNPNLDGMSAALPKQKILSPYDVFNKCISRAKNLIACKQCKDKKENVGDFYRAAVVLSISALDAFIRTTITTRIKDIVLDKKTSEMSYINILKNFCHIKNFLMLQDKIIFYKK
ncbi:MAG: hypothetical protein LBD98_03695 [Endomicrobium sp.]|jgi:hypothetical protein|nr:hypothetical protein [Endomicrobium sp.]